MNAFKNVSSPLAITMWDFSWLERCWPGAGYEDWDLALDELSERGYNAVRIDAYPHLVAADRHKSWEILPEWNTQDWGSPARCRVQVFPALNEFISKCGDRGIRVGLSTWFRQDIHNVRLNIADGGAHGMIWLEVLNEIAQAGLMEHVLYVDLCNEWPLPCWAPFFKNSNPGKDWRTAESMSWMKTAVQTVRAQYPELPLTFSLWPDQQTSAEELAFLDFFDPHLWMVDHASFYPRIGYHFQRFDPVGYENVVRHAEPLYRSNPDFWHEQLRQSIQWNAEVSRRASRPLITTECWSIIDYKDWPLLDWGWVKDVCALGVESAAATGRWAAMATSNFCGPQFRGMWRDVGWHQTLTRRIRSAAMPD